MSKTIAVIFGGRSAEHDVSIITAHVPIIQALQAANGYDVWPVYISKDGSWYSNKAMCDLAYFKDGFEERLSKEKKLQLDLNDGLRLVWPSLRPKSVSIDVVFPAMHGTYGEDGSLMGLLRMANVPFVGCDIFASAVAMDKVLAKQVLAANGVPVVPYAWFTKTDWEADQSSCKKQIAKLKRPLFVKPVHLGSSIGITKVRTDLELENAIEVALHYDDKVLVEEAVEDLIEVTLPIMGNDESRLGAVERALNKTEFFDFNDKYLAGGKKVGTKSSYSELPAQIGENLTNIVKDLGERSYKILGCSGIARLDFLINSKSGKVFVNEVNTLPGSLYHHNWKKCGVSSVELVTTLVALAEERFAKTKDVKYTFKSDILSHTNGENRMNAR